MGIAPLARVYGDALEKAGKVSSLPRLYLRTPISLVRKIFSRVLDPMVRIQHVLGGSFAEVEALLRNGPREERRFVGSVNPAVDCDPNLDMSIRQVQILL